jgi:Icc-related predicted phosphoesterase
MQAMLRLAALIFFVLPVRYLMHKSDRLFLLYPHQIDVLVTHGAPKGILDRNGQAGCPILREIVNAAQPKIHIFGHVHEDGGQEVNVGKTRFMNVAINGNEIVANVENGTF